MVLVPGIEELLPPAGHWKEGTGPQSASGRARRDPAVFRQVLVLLLQSIDEKLSQLLALQGVPVALTAVEGLAPAKGKGRQAKPEPESEPESALPDDGTEPGEPPEQE
jgi:hypothetical protein